MSTLSAPYPVRRLVKRLLRRLGLARIARYTLGFGLAAVVLGVGALNWLPLVSVVLGAAFVFYVATYVDFAGLVAVLRRPRRIDRFTDELDSILKGKIR